MSITSWRLYRTVDQYISNIYLEATIRHDIHVFLQHELAETRDEHSLDGKWSSQDNIQALVDMAVPLFIFAATVCRFVSDPGWNPKERLATILEYQGASHMSTLDSIYTPILDQLLVGQDELESKRLAAKFQEVVEAIVTLADHLSKSLIGIQTNGVTRRLSLLHSVRNMPAE